MCFECGFGKKKFQAKDELVDVVTIGVSSDEEVPNREDGSVLPPQAKVNLRVPMLVKDGKGEGKKVTKVLIVREGSGTESTIKVGPITVRKHPFTNEDVG